MNKESSNNDHNQNSFTSKYIEIRKNTNQHKNIQSDDKWQKSTKKYQHWMFTSFSRLKVSCSQTPNASDERLTGVKKCSNSLCNLAFIVSLGFGSDKNRLIISIPYFFSVTSAFMYTSSSVFTLITRVWRMIEMMDLAKVSEFPRIRCCNSRISSSFCVII